MTMGPAGLLRDWDQFCAPDLKVSVVHKCVITSTWKVLIKYYIYAKI